MGERERPHEGERERKRIVYLRICINLYMIMTIIF
jgi:hypothetical protein